MVFRSLIPEDKPKMRRIVEQMGTFNREEIRVAMELLDEALSYPERQDYHVRCAVDELCSLALWPLPVTVRMSFDLTQKRCPLTARQRANNIVLPAATPKVT